MSKPIRAALTLSFLALLTACMGCATTREPARPVVATPSCWPVPKPYRQISSNFSDVRRAASGGTRPHRGIDIIAPKGTPCAATADGVVTFAGRDGAYGRVIRITHPTGYETWYAHLQDCAVGRGHRVRRGDWIGKTGSSGLSTGPHLHYEVRRNGIPVDPRPYLP